MWNVPRKVWSSNWILRCTLGQIILVVHLVCDRFNEFQLLDVSLKQFVWLKNCMERTMTVGMDCDYDKEYVCIFEVESLTLAFLQPATTTAKILLLRRFPRKVLRMLVEFTSTWQPPQDFGCHVRWPSHQFVRSWPSRCGMKEVCVLLCVTSRLQIKYDHFSCAWLPFIGCLQDEDPTAEANFEQHMHFHEFIEDCVKVAQTWNEQSTQDWILDAHSKAVTHAPAIKIWVLPCPLSPEDQGQLISEIVHATIRKRHGGKDPCLERMHQSHLKLRPTVYLFHVLVP